MSANKLQLLEEAERRGILPPEQKAMLDEARKRGLVQAPASTVGQRGGMVEQGTISREEYMRQRGPVSPAAPSTPSGDLFPMANETGQTPFMKPSISAESLKPGPLGMNMAATRQALDTPQPLRSEKMTMAQSAALGVNDFNPLRLATGDRGYEAAITRSLEDNPVTTRLGQTAALTAGGGAQLTNRAIVAAPKLVAPTVAARLAGNRAAQYAGRTAVLAGTGAADYYAYNALAEAPNISRQSGAPMPSVGERIDYANSQVLSPGGIVSAAAGPIGSALYRSVRAPLAATKNLATTGSATTRRVAGGGTQQVSVANLFTPADVQKRVAGFVPQLTTMNRTDAEKAIDMLLKRGFDPDEAEKMVKFLDYAGKSEVPEMLFQVMPDLRSVDQLTVALGTVGGPAQKMLGDALGKQAQDAPGILRDALRKAMGISGEDYYAMGKGLKAEQLSAPKAGYEAAYGREVTDETWANQIVPALRNSPSAREAVSEASRYAADLGELGVARQLAELSDALGSQGATPGKVSTQSLDYIDRMLGDMAQGIKRGSGRQELARGPVSAQQRIRGDANSGLDAETGLGDPRRLSAELKTAQEALEFGRTAFRNNTDIENLQDEFAGAIAKLGEDGADSETIRGALLMGWLRGAEDEVSKATNPQSVIRRIYGSERQRDKLLAMMPELPEGTGAGAKGSNTKDIRALVGGKREDGRQMAGMIDRLKRLSGDYNRIIGNSQTAQRVEAVAEQGGTQDRLNQFFDFLEAPKAAGVKAARRIVNTAIRPGIYREGVNRELGRLLTARGKKQLLATIAEIRARQIATGKGPKPPAGPAPTGTPPAPPRGTPAGPIRAAGPGALGGDFRNAAFGAGLGGIAPAESNEERLRNMAIGAGIGGASRTVGRLAGAQGDDVARTAGVGWKGPNPGIYRFSPTGQAFNPFSSKVQAEIIRTSGGLVDERNIDDLVDVYVTDLRDSTPQEIVDTLRKQAAFDMENGGVPLTQRDVEYVAFAELMARQLTPMRPDKAASPILTAGAGGGRKPPTGKPSKLGTRTADAAAITMLAAGGPTAEADTGDAQARIADLTQSQATAQQQIAEYQKGLQAFKALPVTEKQRFLKENGFLGKDGKPLVIDGRPEGNTAFAIQAYEAQAGEAIAAAQAERETFRKQINQIRVGLAQKPEKQTNPLIDKLTEYGTYGAVAYLAHRGRGAMVKASQVSANRAAAKANALLTRLPVPPEAPRKTLVSRVPIVGDKQKARIKRETNAANKAQFATEERLAGRDIPPISSNPTSPDGLPNRLANVDEFDRQAAAGDFGPVGRIGRLMEPINSRFRGSDLAVIGTGAADTYITEGMIQETRADIAAEEKRLAEALKANNGEGDPDAVEVSTKRLEQLRQAETVQVILQRVGIGMMIGGGFGLTHGRYARPQPRFEAAARERDLINRAMAPPPPPPANALAPTSTPKKPRTVGTQKPKPKPPVSFGGGRSRKAENDNDR